MRPRYDLLAVGLALLTIGFVRWRDDAPFPHRRHARLFPTCVGCHAGVVAERASDRFPSADACANCHDGRRLKRVSWSAPHVAPTNMKFSHVDHARDAQGRGASVTCQSCHRETATDSVRMAVGRALPTNCIGCHAHQATEHLADQAVCATCHVRLADARALSDSAIGAFPKPPSHAQADFLSMHGRQASADVARCATCHTSESCARCHPNAARVPVIVQLGSDPRVARLVAAKPGVYLTPVSHRSQNWSIDHGGDAKRDAQRCANCHAQPSCKSCHIGRLAASTIGELPAGTGGAPAGIALRSIGTRLAPRDVRRDRAAAEQSMIAQSVVPRGGGQSVVAATLAGDTGKVVRVHAAGFATSHGTSAGSGRLTCLGCHEQRFCSDCHDGSGRRRFHAANYMSRHATDAYSREKNCASCHNTETFCRSCHVGNGIGSKGAARVAVHNGQPLWMLQHGQAARQGLEGCTSCHQQRDCLRCHSSTGLRVNPHGPDFDASRMAARNKQMCLTCHLTDPMKQ